MTVQLPVDYMDQLRQPFHPTHITWKPGAVKGNRALAMPYGDLRAYMNRLDEVCGPAWSVAYEPWGTDRIICRLTINGITRSSTGETSAEAERSEIGGTVAEAQAFKRACAMFGLGRYLYTLPTGWADYDPSTRQFTDQAKAKLTSILVQHYQRALGKPPVPAAPQPSTNGTAPLQVPDLDEVEELDPSGGQAEVGGYPQDKTAERFRQLQGEGDKKVTQKMADRIVSAMEQLCGRGWPRVLEQLTGVSDPAQLSMKAGSTLLEMMHPQMWGKEEGRYVANTKLDPKFVSTIKHWR